MNRLIVFLLAILFVSYSFAEITCSDGTKDDVCTISEAITLTESEKFEGKDLILASGASITCNSADALCELEFVLSGDYKQTSTTVTASKVKISAVNVDLVSATINTTGLGPFPNAEVDGTAENPSRLADGDDAICKLRVAGAGGGHGGMGSFGEWATSDDTDCKARIPAISSDEWKAMRIQGGKSFGDFRSPTSYGGPGSTAYEFDSASGGKGGRGGGIVEIVASGGINYSGTNTLSANGATGEISSNGSGGAGAGGSISIFSATVTYEGNPTTRFNALGGGMNTSGSGACGGGGRIAAKVDEATDFYDRSVTYYDTSVQTSYCWGSSGGTNYHEVAGVSTLSIGNSNTNYLTDFDRYTWIPEDTTGVHYLEMMQYSVVRFNTTVTPFSVGFMETANWNTFYVRGPVDSSLKMNFGSLQLSGQFISEVGVDIGELDEDHQHLWSDTHSVTNTAEELADFTITGQSFLVNDAYENNVAALQDDDIETDVRINKGGYLEIDFSEPVTIGGLEWGSTPDVYRGNHYFEAHDGDSDFFTVAIFATREYGMRALTFPPVTAKKWKLRNSDTRYYLALSSLKFTSGEKVLSLGNSYGKLECLNDFCEINVKGSSSTLDMSSASLIRGANINIDTKAAYLKSTISADYRGQKPGTETDGTASLPMVDVESENNRRYSGAGGTHGGIGALGCYNENFNATDSQWVRSVPAETFGSTTEPTTFGGAGGYGLDYVGEEKLVNYDSRPGRGGGIIKIKASTFVPGYGSFIYARGENPTTANYAFGGAGAGGSLWIISDNVVKHVRGFGIIDSSGGITNPSYNSGNGAGGRIAIYDTSKAIDETYLDRITNKSGGDGSYYCLGGAGTTYFAGEFDDEKKTYATTQLTIAGVYSRDDQPYTEFPSDMNDADVGKLLMKFSKVYFTDEVTMGDVVTEQTTYIATKDTLKWNAASFVRKNGATAWRCVDESERECSHDITLSGNFTQATTGDIKVKNFKLVAQDIIMNFPVTIGENIHIKGHNSEIKGRWDVEDTINMAYTGEFDAYGQFYGSTITVDAEKMITEHNVIFNADGRGPEYNPSVPGAAENTTAIGESVCGARINGGGGGFGGNGAGPYYFYADGKCSTMVPAINTKEFYDFRPKEGKSFGDYRAPFEFGGPGADGYDYQSTPEDKKHGLGAPGGGRMKFSVRDFTFSGTACTFSANGQYGEYSTRYSSGGGGSGGSIWFELGKISMIETKLNALCNVYANGGGSGHSSYPSSSGSGGRIAVKVSEPTDYAYAFRTQARSQISHTFVAGGGTIFYEVGGINSLHIDAGTPATVSIDEPVIYTPIDIYDDLQLHNMVSFVN
eukprot:TRINITY_DN772_c0_g1_i15.p1 TRINITY_DN772_c0_g1~~TRINITY_DN772_c0_g1_i15.p1  ORF type:complete len:1334 (+),score=451.53 TRINITY_DN772_c0_g1_i15:65-4066(+)